MLELDALTKRYGDLAALDRLSFSVEEGLMFGFVGPNGAGKTTAMRIVLGVLAADAGEVRWRGRALDQTARRRIGYMPEERGLYPKMRVGEQLAYFGELHGLERGEAEASARRWSERLGVIDRFEDKVEALSLGNQQRVQLAAALLHDPEVLVLDEPFSGLDPVGVDVLSAVLREEVARRGVPVIFSSHQLELVERLCDAVAIIKDGRLVATGSVEDLRRRDGGRRWRVELEDRDDSWADMPGVQRQIPGVFELSEHADPQDLLDRARSAGRVRRFEPAVPTLAELFREVVSEQPAAEVAVR